MNARMETGADKETTYTYLDYMKEHQDQGFEFCKAYVNGDCAILQYAMETFRAKVDDLEFYGAGCEDAIAQIARLVNPYYADYKGWHNEHIALEAMKRVSCYNCPWKHECYIMDQEYNEEDCGLETVEE